MSAVDVGMCTPPAGDIREALAREIADGGEPFEEDYRAADDVLRGFEVCPRGTVTDRPLDEPRVLSIVAEIVSERGRQDAKWGAPHYVPDGTGRYFRLGEPFANISFRMMRDAMQRDVDARAERGTSTMATVLLEEVFEALAESDEQKLRAELIQVAAVAAKWVQIIDAREVQP